MKKVLAFIAVVALAVSVQAASVGWSMVTGSSAYAGCTYGFFIIGENNVESVTQLTSLLSGADAAKWTDYAFGTGTIGTGATGIGSAAAANSGKTLVPDEYPATYTAVAVLFDTATLTAGTTKFMIFSGQSGMTKTLNNSSAASVTFATGNLATTIASGTWQTYGGAIPEPTTVALLALGLAAVGLKRKVA